MKSTRNVTLATLVLALAASAPAQDYTALETIFFDTESLAMNFDAHAARLIGVIEKDPASAEAWIALTRAMDLSGELATPKPLYDSLRKLAQDDFKRCGLNADAFVSAYEQLAQDFDTDPSWRKLVQKWDPITAASWIGPFTEGGSPAHDDRFAPEVVCDFGRDARGAFGRIKWAAYRPPPAPGRPVALHDQARFGGGGYYVAFSLVSAADREVLIQADTGSPARVWLNGVLLADFDRRRADYPDAWLAASLKRGRNLLLVKLSDSSTLGVIVRTPQGRPVDDLICEAPDATVAPVGIAAGKPVHTEFYPPETAGLRSAKGADARQRALLHLALAHGFAAHGLQVSAAENTEAALAEMPADPSVRLHYLQSLDRSPLCSSSEKRRIRTETLDALLAQNSTLLPALLWRARDHARDDRLPEAADLLDRALKAAPQNWRVQLARSEMFGNVDWDAERLEAIQAARKLAPQALPVLGELANYWTGMGSAAAQISAQREMLALVPARRNVLATLSGLLTRSGSTGEALQVARMWNSLDPGDSFARSRLATVLLASGKLADALAIYDAMTTETAHPEGPLQLAADACFQQGDEARGTQYLAQALAVSPAQYETRRQLERIRGESGDFWSKYALSMEEVQKIELTRSQFPRADSALLLDESIEMHFEDGSSISYVHQVRKILTQNGVDARGKDRVRGELIVARTIQPDGSILEPITYGGGQIEFPGMKIGCLVDLCWIDHRGANPWKAPVGQRFFFNDNDFEEPFAVSRYVVISPKSTPHTWFMHNLKDGEFKLEEDGAMQVRTWDVRRPTHPQAEAFAPSSLETIPWIECVLPRGWENKARDVADRGLATMRDVTSLVRSKAQEITAECKTDETRARAIYTWVNANLTTQGDAGNPHQAIKALAGNRHSLFAALCHAAGVKLGYAAADSAPAYRDQSNSEPPGLDWAGLRDSDFQSFLFVVTGDGGLPLYVDLSARLRPFGYLPSHLSLAPLITWRDGRAELGRLPAVAAGGERMENHATIRLKADGSAEVEGAMIVHGERAWGAKDALRTIPQDVQREQFQREMAQLMPGLDLADYSTPELDKAGTPFKRAYKGEVTGMARKRGAGLAMPLPGLRLGQLLSVLVGTQERNTPIVMSFEFSQRDEIRVVPPQGWRFKALPENLSYPTAPFMFSVKYELEDGALVIRRTLDLGPGRIEPVGYQQLTNQIRSLSQNEETRLELEKVE